MPLQTCSFVLKLLAVTKPSRVGVVNGRVPTGFRLFNNLKTFNEPALGVHVVKIAGITDTVNPVLNLDDLTVTANGATVTNGNGETIPDGTAIATTTAAHVLAIRRTDANAGLLACTGSGDIFPSLPKNVGFVLFGEGDDSGCGIDMTETITFDNSTSAAATIEIYVAYL